MFSGISYFVRLGRGYAVWLAWLGAGGGRHTTDHRRHWKLELYFNPSWVHVGKGWVELSNQITATSAPPPPANVQYLSSAYGKLNFLDVWLWILRHPPSDTASPRPAPSPPPPTPPTTVCPTWLPPRPTATGRTHSLTHRT